MPAIEATPGYRMNVLIRRRAGVSRDELVANWFANHMPGVVKAMANAALAAQPHAHRYIATLFDADARARALLRECHGSVQDALSRLRGGR